MKFSANSGCEGYGNYLTHRPVEIFVDGERLRNALSVDTEEGWADYHPKKDGRFVLGDDAVPVVQRIYGHVQVFNKSGLVAETNTLSQEAEEDA